MSDIDIAAFRREWAGCSGISVPAEPDDSCFSCVVLTLCDEIDALRALVAEYRAESNETWTAIRADRDALAAKVAAVAALCAESERSNDEFDGFPDAYVDTRDLRAAIGGPVDDA